jgi:hypothetical protein
MIDEARLRDILREWNRNGMMPLIYFHLVSLTLVSEIFGRCGWAKGRRPCRIHEREK